MKLFPACYGPEPAQLSRLRNTDEIILSGAYPFEKGSCHSRMRIMAASGPLLLSIPVKKHAKGALIHEIETDTAQKWQHQHWRSIFSAYGKSPFFHYFRDELESLFMNRTHSLVAYTAGILGWALRQYYPGKKIHVSLTAFSGKDEIEKMDLLPLISLPSTPPYRQVFGPDFVKDMGMLDHIFCAGPKCIWSLP
jgi:hypothetical protein